MRTFPCMYPNIFFSISCTGLDLYLIQTIRPGLQNREKRGRAIEWVKSMKCDIAYFQETYFDQNIENEINFNTDFNVYGSIGTFTSRG
jgi:hypothetical protein